MFRSFVTSVHINWVASGFEFSFKGWSSELRKLKNAEAMRGLERENIELICCSWRLHRLNSHWAPNKQPVTLAITGEKLNPGSSCLLVTSPFTKLLESEQLVNDVYTVTGHLVPTVVSYQSFCTQSVESFRTQTNKVNNWRKDLTSTRAVTLQKESHVWAIDSLLKISHLSCAGQ